MSCWLFLGLAAYASAVALGHAGAAEHPSTPEGVIRALVRANEAKDLETMNTLMADDPDTVSYSIGGRKYVGWEPFAREMEQEFADAKKIEIPITSLRVWSRADVAWFAMELDYIRYLETDAGLERMVLPLRETGVLERRAGKWILVAWHESERVEGKALRVTAEQPLESPAPPEAGLAQDGHVDLSGEWLVEEEDKSYTAYLDYQGNGTYTHQGGTFRTIQFNGRTLVGTWNQTGNDREGGFEVLLSEDGNTARGVWWYTRVGERRNIPPRMHGGPYVWTRVSAGSQGAQAQISGQQ